MGVANRVVQRAKEGWIGLRSSIHDHLLGPLKLIEGEVALEVLHGKNLAQRLVNVPVFQVKLPRIEAAS